MNQKGFIPIIFIMIIGAVVATSATFGVVKYKDKIAANVSNVFKNIIDAPNRESIEKIEESELSEESTIKETSETEGKQDDAQKLQEQLRIAEQKQLEAEKQLAEERARRVAEKIKAEEEAKIKAEQEAQRLAEEQKKQDELQRQEAQRLAEEQKARNDEITQRYQRIFGLVELFNKLEQNYKDPLSQASGLYAELLLKEYSMKRLTILDQAIPEIKAALRIPNLPYQFVSLSNQLLDILTIKRENNLNFLNNPQSFLGDNISTYTPPSYTPYTPPSYNPLPNYSLPPLSTLLPQTYSLLSPSPPPIKTPYEIEYDIKVCESIGGTYSLGLGCGGY